MTGDPHAWASDLKQLYGQVWQRLGRGVGDRHAPARHPTLATVSPEGRPRARTVVLRRADAASGMLDVHTDIQSAKVADLRATPFAALHVWDGSGHLQIRAEVEVTIASGDEMDLEHADSSFVIPTMAWSRLCNERDRGGRSRKGLRPLRLRCFT